MKQQAFETFVESFAIAIAIGIFTGTLIISVCFAILCIIGFVMFGLPIAVLGFFWKLFLHRPVISVSRRVVLYKDSAVDWVNEDF